MARMSLVSGPLWIVGSNPTKSPKLASSLTHTKQQGEAFWKSKNAFEKSYLDLYEKTWAFGKALCALKELTPRGNWLLLVENLLPECGNANTRRKLVSAAMNFFTENPNVAHAPHWNEESISKYIHHRRIEVANPTEPEPDVLENKTALKREERTGTRRIGVPTPHAVRMQFDVWHRAIAEQWREWDDALLDMVLGELGPIAVFVQEICMECADESRFSSKPKPVKSAFNGKKNAAPLNTSTARR